MNLILIISDTMRRDYLGCYGNEWVKTPNIDAFAREATVFDNAYVGSFPTMPMRADMLTGHYVFQTVGWAPIQKGMPTLQGLLRRDGYVTQMVTDHVQMLSPGMNYHQGFSGHQWVRGQASDPWITDPIEFEPPCALEKLRQPENWLAQYHRNISRRRTEADWFSPQTMQASMDWLERNYTHERFFLYVDTFDVHEPWTPPKWYVEMYDPGYEGEEVIYPRYDREGYMSEAELQHARCLYAGTITMVDRWLGMLLQKVKDLGIWDETAIAFTADHGWYHGEHGYIGKHTVLEPKKGWPFYDEVARIPFMLKAPGLPAGERSDVLLQPVDMMPTLLEICGVEPPRVHGMSFLAAVRGEAEEPREIAVSSPLLGTDEDALVYSTIADGGWALIYGGENAPPELYDTDADPKQERNVIEEHRGVAEELHRQHVELLEEIGTEEARLRLRRRLPEV